MKFIKIIGVFLVSIQVTACAINSMNKTSNDSSPLAGSWQLISEEIRIGDQTYPTFDPKTRKMMKMFNDTHFSFVSTGDKRPHFSSYQLTPDEKLIAFDNFGGGAGRYTYADGYLTEHVEYMNYPNYEGVSLKFKITINGDTLIQEGDYPITQLGLGSKDGYLYSVFKKVE